MRRLCEIDADLANSHQALDVLIAAVKEKTMRADQTWKIAFDGLSRKIDRLNAERDAAVAAITN